jgi:hypothetical protein
MPADFSIDTDRRLVISRGIGTFRFSDFLGQIRQLGPDPRFRPEFDHMVDCRQCTEFDLSAAQIEEMGAKTIFASTSKRAMVVSSDRHFGMGRMFASYRELFYLQTTMVFREMREAVAWLGLPEDYDPGASGSDVEQ